MLERNRIHIRPEDYLAQFDEYDDPEKHGKSFVRYYIPPYGPHEANEMSDTYYQEGDHVIYHEHERGFETFLVDAGRVEVTIYGKKCVLKKGDMVHIPPYTPHGFHFLENGTIWRELFQEIQMNPGMMAHIRLKSQNPEIIQNPAFQSCENQRHKSIWFDYEPDAVQTTKDKIPQVRPFETGLAEFTISGGNILRQKVGRAETKGVKEIWQMQFSSPMKIKWIETNPFWKLYVVYQGEAEVNIRGEKPFLAKERDIIHVPSYLAGEILCRKGTILLDYNCEGYLMRAMESVHNRDQINELNEALNKYDCYFSFEKGSD